MSLARTKLRGALGLAADEEDVALSALHRPKEKDRLRRQARDWLRDALEIYTQQLAEANAKKRQGLQKTLREWQQDEDLASVRDKEALARLSETERAAWQQLWADVETLRQKASA